MPQPIALITGVTGQDGSYLAELLLERDYRVVGMTRRTSTDVHERIGHLAGRIEIVSGDLLDQSSMSSIIAAVRPNEIYNLAAQSFVPTSWTQPVLTGEFTALGVTRLLEAIRAVDPSIKFYQASSSEMFGKVQTVPQNEQTPFYPRSPYGVAKLYGHWITVNYRESYDIFACSGILFNHESVPDSTPVIVRENCIVDVKPIGEILRVREKGPNVQRFEPQDLEVWDGDDFVPVRGGTAYRHRAQVENKGVARIEARCGTVTTTADHVIFMADGERAAKNVEAGQRMVRAELPEIPSSTLLTKEAAWMLGMFVGDGSAYMEGNRTNAKFVNSNSMLRAAFADVWKRVTCGDVRYSATTSGFIPGKVVGALVLSGAPTYVEWLRSECYTEHGYKRVPRVVLNGGIDVWRAFLAGYNSTGGLKAGNGTYVYKNFKTNSAVLAMGLWWMANRALGQETVLNVEVGPTERPGPFYSINLRSPSVPGAKGAHLKRDLAEVKRVVPQPHYEGWLYDFTTTSGRFHAGVGNCLIHNSPRRGKEFVTRKISDGVARIKLGIASELRLGNLDAKRDWGFAGDYVRAMWMMMQRDRAEDFVVASGRTHEVRDFVRLAFAAADLDWEPYTVVDRRFYRPAEVDLLVGDPGKAKAVLGWQAELSFEELVQRMVAADLDRLRPLVAT